MLPSISLDPRLSTTPNPFLPVRLADTDADAPARDRRHRDEPAGCEPTDEDRANFEADMAAEVDNPADLPPWNPTGWYGPDSDLW